MGSIPPGWGLSTTPGSLFRAQDEDDRANQSEDNLPGIDAKEGRTADADGQRTGGREANKRVFHGLRTIVLRSSFVWARAQAARLSGGDGAKLRRPTKG